MQLDLTNGFVATIDDEDAELVAGYSWSAKRSKSNWYAVGYRGEERVLLHRLILGVDEESMVDHRDRDTMNNRRANLRRSTNRQNARNRGPGRQNRSGFKNISLSVVKGYRYWLVTVKGDAPKPFTKRFKHIGDAVACAKAKRLELHGEFACD